MLLKFIEGALLAIFLFLLFAQVVIPAAQGRRLFPAFRKNELAAKADAMRDEVGDLVDQTESLQDIVDLTKEKQRLEQELEAAEAKPATAAAEQAAPIPNPESK